MRRDDGSEVALHPNWNNTGIEYSIPDYKPDFEIPKSGIGGTSGPGTFKYFKGNKKEGTLHCDLAKDPANGQDRLAAKRSGQPRWDRPRMRRVARGDMARDRLSAMCILIN